MDIALNLGKRTVPAVIPDHNLQAVLYPKPPKDVPDADALIRRALANPVGAPRLAGIVKPGETVAIVTSDITRPMPSHIVLPHVLRELEDAGIPDKDIMIVFGLGIHRAHTPEEMRTLAGSAVYDRYRCINSDPERTVHLGVTKLNGTPVDVFEEVHKVDRRICLGNIELHYIAGYSGGAKAIMPGVSSRATIQANHSLMTRPDARCGETANLLRRDMEEAAGIVGIDFIVNVVLDEKKNILHAVAGHYVEAQREGARHVDAVYKAPLEHPADIVITCAGGNPKDLNLYQSQKALENAKYAVRDGGIVILVASCKEGLGEDVFEEWMLAATSPDELVARIQKEFVLGGHKAAAIAMVMQRAKVFLVSDMDPDFARKLLFYPFPDVDSAIAAALAELGPGSGIVVMPFGGSTLPSVVS